MIKSKKKHEAYMEEKQHKTSVNLFKLSIVAVNGDKYKAHWFLCVVAEGFGATPSDGRTDVLSEQYHLISYLRGSSYACDALCGIKGVSFYCHLFHCPLQIISKLPCGNLRHRTS